jgi:ribosomal protein S18 acetylase RimI-like enzyme
MRDIREATESDRDLLVEMYLNDIERDQKKARTFADDLVDRLNTIVCVDTGRVVGVLSWDRRGGVEDGVVELVTVGVSPDHKRRGIGSDLVKAMIRSAEKSFTGENSNVRFVYLFMEKRNEPARRFYQSLGFEEVCVVPFMYPNDHASVWTMLTQVHQAVLTKGTDD